MTGQMIMLKNSYSNYILEGNIDSKHNKFVMILIPYFVQKMKDDLSKSDIESAFRVYVNYMTLLSREYIDRYFSKYSNNSIYHELLQIQSSIVNFPSKTDEDCKLQT